MNAKQRAAVRAFLSVEEQLSEKCDLEITHARELSDKYDKFLYKAFQAFVEEMMLQYAGNFGDMLYIITQYLPVSLELREQYEKLWRRSECKKKKKLKPAGITKKPCRL
jgi:hypothetical protein